jgi:putative aldouronate transport system permease protein
MAMNKNTHEKHRIKKWTAIRKYEWFYIMFLPVLAGFLVFNYIPMAGIVYSFFDYTPYGKARFVGLENFHALFSSRLFWRAFSNTLEISFVNMVLSLVCSVGLALLIDEVRTPNLRKAVQTIDYLPHFLSWIVVASVFTLVLSPKRGIVNYIIVHFGGKAVYFLADEKWWRPVFYFLERWKETGWGTIIFIAAITGIDSNLYEAAAIDGVNHFQRVFHVTIPAIANTILIVFVLNLAHVLNLFEPVWVLQNAMVQKVCDVIGTYVYRIGIDNADYGLSTAAGLFKSVVSVILVSIANYASKKIKGEGVV